VVPGRLTKASIEKQIRDGGGMAELKTVSGGSLTAWVHDGKLMLRDEKGGMSEVTIENVMQSNGVIQVVDTVLMPN
jgi:uncharacterized surface protein with fasciclin (FAS1) repeats